MNKRIIKQLVMASYTDEELDATKVTKVANILNKRDLKQYINALKYRERQETTTITIPDAGYEPYIDEVTSLFPNKNIVVKRNPDLILGVKITDNDKVYELNLKNTLDTMIKHIEETYD